MKDQENKCICQSKKKGMKGKTEMWVFISAGSTMSYPTKWAQGILQYSLKIMKKIIKFSIDLKTTEFKISHSLIWAKTV